MSELTATERLRALLDERGVKHTDPAEWLTYWNDADGHVWSASEMKTGLLSVSTAGVGSLTPEQAIAATLGPETCEVVSSTLHEYEGGYAGSEWEHELSCGDTVWWGSGDAPEWCPWCGAKVVG